MNHYSHFYKYTLLFFVIIILFIIVSCSEKEEVPEVIVEETVEFDKYNFPVDSFDVTEGQVKRNETLAEILVNSGIGYTLATEIYEKAKPVFDFRKIQPGKNYQIYKEFDSLATFSGFF